MNLLPKSGEDSPHTGIIRINWEVFPTSPDGSYSNNMPVDVGVLLMRTDGLTFLECQEKVNSFLNKRTEDQNFIHIWKKGQIQ